MPYGITHELAEDQFRAIAVRLLNALMLQEIDEAAASRECIASTNRLEMPLHDTQPRKRLRCPLLGGAGPLNIVLFPIGRGLSHNAEVLRANRPTLTCWHIPSPLSLKRRRIVR